MANEFMSLEELNRQFAEEQQEDNKKRKRSGVLRILLIIIILIALIALIVIKGKGFVQGLTEKKSTTTVEESIVDSDVLPAILSGQKTELTAEELEKWMDIDKNDGKVYIDVESIVPVYGDRAYVNIVNPIYNSYTFSIRVISEDESEVYLEESAFVEPGMSLKAVELTNTPEGDCEAVVEMIFYKDKEEELGRHKVGITLKNQNK